MSSTGRGALVIEGVVRVTAEPVQGVVFPNVNISQLVPAPESSMQAPHVPAVFVIPETAVCPKFVRSPCH